MSKQNDDEVWIVDAWVSSFPLPGGWYRIYRELKLNLRIKPRKRLVREKPTPLHVPQAINEVWSMDFMHQKFDTFSSQIRFSRPGRSINSITYGDFQAEIEKCL
jgi:hypothetical protein